MSENSSGNRNSAYLIVNALFWAAAMLVGAQVFKAEPWSDQLVLWLMVAFITINGLLVARKKSKSRRCD